MYCTNCGQQIDDKADVCVHCGVKQGKVSKYCYNCGQPVNENASICIKCGAKVLKETNSDPLAGFSGGTRQKLVAALLCFFLGTLGIHDFYLGYKSRGIIKIVCTITGIGAVITLIWSIVDLVQILTGSKKDIDGNDLI